MQTTRKSPRTPAPSPDAVKPLPPPPEAGPGPATPPRDSGSATPSLSSSRRRRMMTEGSTEVRRGGGWVDVQRLLCVQLYCNEASQ